MEQWHDSKMRPVSMDPTGNRHVVQPDVATGGDKKSREAVL